MSEEREVKEKVKREDDGGYKIEKEVKDEKKVFEWYFKSAENVNAFAQNNLIHC